MHAHEKYTNTYIYYVLKSIGPPPCPRGSAQLAGASGNFFRRNNTFFLLFIDFLMKIWKKIEFFKNFHFRQIFGLRRATFIPSFTLARSYRLIWNLDRNIGHDRLYPEITSNWKLNGWTTLKIQIFILNVTNLSHTSFFQIYSNTVLL